MGDYVCVGTNIPKKEYPVGLRTLVAQMELTLIFQELYDANPIAGEEILNKYKLGELVTRFMSDFSEYNYQRYIKEYLEQNPSEKGDLIEYLQSKVAGGD